MKKYKVLYTTDASCDVSAIFNGIISGYGDALGAMRTVDRILKRCDKLAIFPEVSPVKAMIKDKKIYFAHVGKFTAIFTIDKARSWVIIYRIVGSHMDMRKLVQELGVDF